MAIQLPSGDGSLGGIQIDLSVTSTLISHPSRKAQLLPSGVSLDQGCLSSDSLAGSCLSHLAHPVSQSADLGPPAFLSACRAAPGAGVAGAVCPVLSVSEELHFPRNRVRPSVWPVAVGRRSKDDTSASVPCFIVSFLGKQVGRRAAIGHPLEASAFACRSGSDGIRMRTAHRLGFISVREHAGIDVEV